MSDLPEPSAVEGRCELCAESMPSADLLEHLRLMHPDEYGDGPESWPDGGPVIIDQTGDMHLTPPRAQRRRAGGVVSRAMFVRYCVFCALAIVLGAVAVAWGYETGVLAVGCAFALGATFGWLERDRSKRHV